MGERKDEQREVKRKSKAPVEVREGLGWVEEKERKPEEK